MRMSTSTWSARSTPGRLRVYHASTHASGSAPDGHASSASRVSALCTA